MKGSSMVFNPHGATVYPLAFPLPSPSLFNSHTVSREETIALSTEKTASPMEGGNREQYGQKPNPDGPSFDCVLGFIPSTRSAFIHTLQQHIHPPDMNASPLPLHICFCIFASGIYTPTQATRKPRGRLCNSTNPLSSSGDR